MKRSTGLFLLLTAALVNASPILLQSGSSPGESVMVNSGLGPNCSGTWCNATNPSSTSYTAGSVFDIPLGDDAPGWVTPAAGSYWISYMNTGWNTGAGSAFNTVPDAGCTTSSTAKSGNCQPTAEFFQTFSDSDPDLILTLSIWADDTAAVYLDGNLIFAPNFGQGSACSAGPVTCTGPGASYTSIAGALASGVTHTLEFDVYQTGGWTYGLMYNGMVSGDPVQGMPEPSTLGLIGGGLFALGFIRRKRIF